MALDHVYNSHNVKFFGRDVSDRSATRIERVRGTHRRALAVGPDHSRRSPTVETIVILGTGTPIETTTGRNASIQEAEGPASFPTPRARAAPRKRWVVRRTGRRQFGSKPDASSSHAGRTDALGGT